MVFAVQVMWCFDALMQFELRERQKRAEPQSEAAERRRQNYVQRYMSQFLPPPEPVYVVSSFSIVTHRDVIFKCPVQAPGINVPLIHCKKYGAWWRWALVSPNGVAPSRMVGVSPSVNLPLHHKVQKFSSGTGSPAWSRKKGHKMVVVWWWWLICWSWCYVYILFVSHLSFFFFTCFLTYLFPYFSFPLRIDPLCFQAGGHKRRPNLGFFSCFSYSIFVCFWCMVICVLLA